jgi:hypothetical protein
VTDICIFTLLFRFKLLIQVLFVGRHFIFIVILFAGSKMQILYNSCYDLKFTCRCVELTTVQVYVRRQKPQKIIPQQAQMYSIFIGKSLELNTYKSAKIKINCDLLCYIFFFQLCLLCRSFESLSSVHF